MLFLTGGNHKVLNNLRATLGKSLQRALAIAQAVCKINSWCSEPAALL